MKILSTIFASIFVSQLIFSQVQVVDKVVAKIGEKVILLSDIQAQKLQMITEKQEVNASTDCLILEELMFNYLLLHQADLDSVTVTEQQVEAELEQRLRYFEAQIGGRDKLEEFYGKSVFQIKTEFRVIIRDRMIAQEMERKITEGISITPREVREFFESIPRDSLPFINARVGIQQIVIYPQITEADKLKTKKRLDDIRKLIVSGASTINSEAVKHSEDPGSRAQGGLIEGYRGQMVKEFDAMAFSLQIGEVSPVFETQFGYHIMKLESRRGDAYTCRHVLLIPEVSDAEFDKAIVKIEECHKKVKSGELSWDEAVRQYSNDATTKNNKGLVTNPYTGEPTWDFEDLNQIDRQMAILIGGLKPGDVSAPSVYDNMMESKQGVRIVRLVERSTPHQANMEDDYQMIQNAALNKKRQEIVEKWVNEKIGNAFIRIAPEYSNCDYIYKWIRLNP
jgi:peptidyl-prolyl cis-trans isomerase SurA